MKWNDLIKSPSNKTVARSIKGVRIRDLMVIILVFLMLYGCGSGTATSTATTASIASPTTAATVTATPQLHVAAVLPSILPTDVSPTCTVTTGGAPAFASWFASGSVTPDGLVKPADSANFPNNGNCDFYQWSEQMFLWLTSPTSGGPYGEGHVFDSPVFYQVSPKDANGYRTFIQQGGNARMNLEVRGSQPGPHNLPMITDSNGNEFEVHPPDPTQVVIDQTGKKVEVANIEQVNGKPVFFDSAGKEITGAKPVLPDEFSGGAVVKQFTDDDGTFFLNADGSSNFEQGQAGGGAVLQAQNGSLVYYSILANDVFAYYRTGDVNGQFSGGNSLQFPVSTQEVATVVAYATAAPTSAAIPDADALAMEVKMAWVEVNEKLPNPESYITIEAEIPNYDTSNNYTWTLNTQQPSRPAILALVGFHIVGSAVGHPEMIWSTFEHVNNTPLAAYDYINAQGAQVSVPQQPTQAANWTFSAGSAATPFNSKYMKTSGDNIVAVTTTTPIAPSNTIRWKAWGAAANISPNPLVTSAAASNSEILSINTDVISQLLNPDVRANYIFTGSTWTKQGAAPTGSVSFPTATPGGPTPLPPNEVGTSLLDNTTMETYFQGTDNTNLGGGNNLLNCFSCHTGQVNNTGPSTNTIWISHIYPDLNPLFGPTLTPVPTATPTTAPTPTSTSKP